MPDLSLEVLRTDIAGMPLEWIDYQQAAKLLSLEQVSYALGAVLYEIRGGVNALTGQRSLIRVNAIVATKGSYRDDRRRLSGYAPPLSNRALFKRDQNLCLYCGEQFLVRDLSRDHVTPLSQGGQDNWRNVVTACKRCNNHKAGRTPEEAGMQLLAIPFVPTHAEYVYLQGKRILADQMDFLLAHFPRNSPLRARIEQQRRV
ncbi:MAG: HNH endonuclease [Xanthomonadales bacterium]|nr:HNH endonuclease [Xanthomonadales bacterium]